MTEKQLWTWLVRGLGGAVRMVEKWTATGYKADDETVQELTKLHLDLRQAVRTLAERAKT